ncbi:hypothetical protein Vafri_16707, partial [Volvox africanus]
GGFVADFGALFSDLAGVTGFTAASENGVGGDIGGVVPGSPSPAAPATAAVAADLYDSAVAAGRPAISNYSDGTPVVNGSSRSGSSIAVAAGGVSTSKTAITSGGSCGGCSNENSSSCAAIPNGADCSDHSSVRAAAEAAAAPPGAIGFLISTLGATSPFSATASATAFSGADNFIDTGTFSTWYGANSSYGPYQTAHFVASAASLSNPTFTADTTLAAAEAVARRGANAANMNASLSGGTAAGGGGGATIGGGANMAMTTTVANGSIAAKEGGVPATKTTPLLPADGTGSSSSSSTITAGSILGSSSSSSSSSGIEAASSEDGYPGYSPTSDQAFNPFENATPIPSPGSPLLAPKPGFYFTWLRGAEGAAAVATTSVGNGSVSNATFGYGDFNAASAEVPEGGIDLTGDGSSSGGSSSSGSSSSGSGSPAVFQFFYGLPVSTFGFINGQRLGSAKQSVIKGGSSSSSSSSSGSGSGSSSNGFSAASEAVEPSSASLDVQVQSQPQSQSQSGAVSLMSLPADQPGRVCLPCTDTPPGGRGALNPVTCSQLVASGACGDDWVVLEHVCDGSCGRCPYVEPCTDIRPVGMTGSCEQLRDGGKCAEGLVVAAGWCRLTCGRCYDSGRGMNRTASSHSTATSGSHAADVKNGNVGGLAADEGHGSGIDGTSSGSSSSYSSRGGGGDASGECWVMGCSDLPPPGTRTDGCGDVVRNGRCSSPWVRSRGYCAESCGRCRRSSSGS